MILISIYKIVIPLLSGYIAMRSAIGGLLLASYVCLLVTSKSCEKTAEVSRVETQVDPAYGVGRGQFDRGSPAPKGPKSEAQMADTVRMGSWRGAVSPSPLARVSGGVL